MSRARYAIAALLYALAMAYASTFVGRLGPHFVPLEPSEALSRLIHIPYVQHGSDQRSDWMSNVMMLIPLGFLVTGWLSRPARASLPPAAGAFLLCSLFILTVKFAQLYFPPRTVTLNYVIAQCLGAVVGIGLFAMVREPLARARHGMSHLESLRLALRIYTGLLIGFFLMPLDFALSVDDLITQLDKLPDTFTAISGAGRPWVVRLAVILGGVVATMPVGAMLTIVGRGRVYIGRSVGDATWMGFCLMAGIYALSSLLISGAPSLSAIGFRTIGITLGAWGLHGLTRQDPEQIRRGLGQLVPWLVPVYLLALAGVNGLLSFDWTTPAAAADDFYAYGLIPFYNYYIVTKPQAAKNIIDHAILYAPIGVMIWLRARPGGGKAAAIVVAATLSAIVEAGRFLRPGLVADINAIPLAGASAWAAWATMPMLWHIFSTIAIGVPTAVPRRPADGTLEAPAQDWRDRETDRRTRRRDRSNAIGDVEHY